MEKKDIGLEEMQLKDGIYLGKYYIKQSSTLTKNLLKKNIKSRIIELVIIKRNRLNNKSFIIMLKIISTLKRLLLNKNLILQNKNKLFKIEFLLKN